MKEDIQLDYLNIPLAARTAKALASEVRLNILKTLEACPMNISEVAEKVGIPISTAAMHIRTLEDAELVVTQALPGLRGFQKVCGLKAERVEFALKQESAAVTQNVITLEMPIGNYFDCQVFAPCGIVSDSGYLSSEDSVCGFFSPQKHTAQLLWLSRGYLEYRFTNYRLKRIYHMQSVEFSFEICSEAPAYNNTWKSDITVWLNGQEAGATRCNGDYGGRRGKLNPEWWSDDLTQYGELHALRVTRDGCYVDGTRASDKTLDSLHLFDGDFISLKIGLKDTSKYVGGLNLFGDKFGDFPQSIVMKAIY